MDEAGREFADCFSSNSHLDPFPHSGAALVSSTGLFAKEMTRIQKNVADLENKEFWGEDKKLAELEAAHESVLMRLDGNAPPPL